MTLVDTNILIEVLSGDPRWAQASIESLMTRKQIGPLAINDIIYAELAAGFDSREQLDGEVELMGLSIVGFSRQALFLAGQAFRAYRAAGGSRSSVLADFFIGAQAAAEAWPILTRDSRLYRTYFPEVAIIGSGA